MTDGLSVLIVDDDPGSLQLLHAILGEAGFTVRTAERPTLALHDMERSRPDILLTDLRMPEMSGLELLRASRSLFPEICCLVITGFATQDAVAEAFRAGAQDLLLKPINVQEVQARVSRAAEVVLLRREVRALRAEQSSTRAASPTVSRTDPSGGGVAPRARELHDLPTLPGSAAPMEVGGREEGLARLERLAGLLRQGVITAAEFEHKKRTILSRL